MLSLCNRGFSKIDTIDGSGISKDCTHGTAVVARRGGGLALKTQNIMPKSTAFVPGQRPALCSAGSTLKASQGLLRTGKVGAPGREGGH